MMTHLSLHQQTEQLLNQQQKWLQATRDIHSNTVIQKDAEQALKTSKKRYRSLVENAPYSIYELDCEGNVLSINKAGLKLFGFKTAEAIISKPFVSIACTVDKGALKNSVKQALKSFSDEFEFTSDSSGKQFKSCLIPLFNHTGEVYRLMGLSEDITPLKKYAEQVWEQTNFDVLTQLPNRHMFHDRLEQEIKKAHRSKEIVALMFIDIDRFREINDALGHRLGDVLLQQVAQRLLACVRESDTISRLGGDEFSIIVSKPKDPSNIEYIAQNILDKVNQPYQLQNEDVYVSVSIGITLYPDDAETVDQLINNADQAMYAAKDEGRNRYYYFTPFMQKAAEVRMQVANDLRIALKEKQFQLYYQPIIDLNSGEILKAEALIRWHHPEHGLISPEVFIPIAEESNMIMAIGDWVFYQAVQQIKHWRDHYHPDFQVSINKSPVQFHNSHENHSDWFKHLKEQGVSGKNLVIEITEGMLLNSDLKVKEQLADFSRAGIQISLDDFGTGYSSLSYLKKFDMDYLKIDQSFVRNLEEDSDDLVLCEAIIVMAHKLGIKVIAEGIETAAQQQLLCTAGCNYGQGYLFSRPVPADEFDQLLAQL